MIIEIRPAVASDAAGLLAVKSTIWPDEAVTQTDYTARVIGEPDHLTVVACVDGVVAGFVDGFLTLAANGDRRWEVDLLAVHPDYRRMGLARRLIAANTQAGFKLGADLARALIKRDNHASQHAFAACGYICNDEAHALYISTRGGCAGLAAPPGAYLIPVHTLGYRGLWVEGLWSAKAFDYARAVQARLQYDVAGAVLPLTSDDMTAAAERAGFAPTGIYHWWRFRAVAAPAPR